MHSSAGDKRQGLALLEVLLGACLLSVVASTLLVFGQQRLVRLQRYQNASIAMSRLAKVQAWLLHDMRLEHQARQITATMPAQVAMAPMGAVRHCFTQLVPVGKLKQVVNLSATWVRLQPCLPLQVNDKLWLYAPPRVAEGRLVAQQGERYALQPMDKRRPDLGQFAPGTQILLALQVCYLCQRGTGTNDHTATLFRKLSQRPAVAIADGVTEFAITEDRVGQVAITLGGRRYANVFELNP